MKQNNQSSWAARLRKMSALCLMLLVSAGAWAANELTVKPNIKAGETGTITIALDNATDYTAFQMEITLPEGLSLKETEGQNDAMTIVSTVDADHHVLYNKVDGVIKVAAYSFDGASNGNEAFKANGDFLVIEVTADANYTPDEVEIKGIIFVTQSDLDAVTNENFTVVNEQGEEILMGDVNGDGSIDMKDALAVIKYYVGNAPENFNAAVADLVEDFGEIDMKDALAIVKIYTSN